MSDRPTVFITAADVSGDVHAAGLIEELRRRLPAARCVGIGGQASQILCKTRIVLRRLERYSLQIEIEVTGRIVYPPSRRFVEIHGLGHAIGESFADSR